MPDAELAVALERLKDNFPTTAEAVVSEIQKARKASGLERRTPGASAEVRIGHQIDYIAGFGVPTAAAGLGQRLQAGLPALKVAGSEEGGQEPAGVCLELRCLAIGHSGPEVARQPLEQLGKAAEVGREFPALLGRRPRQDPQLSRSIPCYQTALRHGPLRAYLA